MSDWIKHKGGKCPVPGDTKPSIRFRDGVELDYPGFNRVARTLRWSHLGTNTDIVAYKPE